MGHMRKKRTGELYEFNYGSSRKERPIADVADRENPAYLVNCA